MSRIEFGFKKHKLIHKISNTSCTSTISAEDQEGSLWLSSHESPIISKVAWMMFGMSSGLGELSEAM